MPDSATPIDDVKARLTKYPGVRYTETPTSIEVHPRDDTGFSVSLHLESDGLGVSFEGWHERFDTEDGALNCFAFGLSSACRLGIVYHGTTPTKWIVESLRDGAWERDSEVGLLLVPFWRSRRVEYKQNHLVPAT